MRWDRRQREFSALRHLREFDCRLCLIAANGPAAEMLAVSIASSCRTGRVCVIVFSSASDWSPIVNRNSSCFCYFPAVSLIFPLPLCVLLSRYMKPRDKNTSFTQVETRWTHLVAPHRASLCVIVSLHGPGMPSRYYLLHIGLPEAKTPVYIGHLNCNSTVSDLTSLQ